MNFPSPILPPSSCDENTDLRPYVENLVSCSKLQKKSHFLSVTLETDYSDPLAILEEIHQEEVPICYLERPTNEFSIAAGEYLCVSRFSGPKRFHHARQWADAIFSKTVVAGDHKITGTGPTLFLSATFENESVVSGSPPPLEIFLPRWQVVSKEGFNFLILNVEICPKSSPEIIIHEFNTHISKIRGLRYDSNNAKDPQTVKVGSPTENYNYEEGVELALREIKKQKLSKVVLSRQLSFDTESKLPAFSIAHALREKFSDCHTFCVSQPNLGLMVGATPETL